MPELAVVGRRIPAIDAIEKCTGRASFASDLRLPGMLYGKVLRGPHPHARIVRLDTSRAECLPGVRAVATARDTPGVKYGHIVPDELLLAAEFVRFAGEEVAAVAATDEATAEQALELIEVEYQPLPAVFDPLEAMAAGAPLVHEDRDSNIVLSYQIARGDVDEAFRAAEVVVEERFTTSMVHQGYLEPVVCLAQADASGHVTVWLPVQSAHSARNHLAKALGLPPGRVRVIQPLVGGGFGGKNEHRLHAICALLALKAGRPVRMAHSRVEEMTSGLPRVPMVIDLKLGARRDGTLLAKQARIVADNGAYTNLAPPVLSVAAMRVDTLYRIQHVRTEAALVYTNKVPTGTFRGFGNPQMTFAMESLVDELAARVGIDPVELRLKNATRTGDVSPHGYIVRSCGLSDCIDRATTAAGWQQTRRERPAGRGLGIACCVHVSSNRAAFPMFDGSSALVKLGDDGVARVYSGETDTGQGARTVFAQIAAEELCLPVDQIAVAEVDTDISPFGIGSVSSRVTMVGGNAVRAAAADARRQVLEVAAGLLEASAEDLDLEDGRIQVAGAPSRSLGFWDTVKAGVYRQGGAAILGQGTYLPDNVVVPDPASKYGNVSAAYPFAAHVAEVQVDPETGRVQVLRLTAAHDLGRAINPLAAEGQIEGGVAQGVGYALTEEMIGREGAVANPSFVDYRLPTALDVPAVQSLLIETIDPAGPYGAKGIGEPALIPVAAAIANAIYDAVGVRLTTLPFTPERVLRALRERSAGVGSA